MGLVTLGFAAGYAVHMFWGRRVCKLVSQVLPSLWPR